MSKLIRYTDGIVIEVEEYPASVDEQDERLGRNATGVEALAKRFEDQFSGIVKVAETLSSKVKTLKPDEVTIKFQVKINSVIGAVIAKTEAEGQFAIELTWKNESGNPDV